MKANIANVRVGRNNGGDCGYVDTDKGTKYVPTNMVEIKTKSKGKKQADTKIKRDDEFQIVVHPNKEEGPNKSNHHHSVHITNSVNLVVAIDVVDS